MTRTIDKTLSVWLTGYYEDFINCKAVMDDLNSVAQTATYTHTKTHHGNPMNSEATLNPRYRYAYVERNAASSGQHNASSAIFSTKYLHNGGIGNFLTHDIRGMPITGSWVTKAQPAFPSSLVANRQKYNASGSDGYLTFAGGNDTSKRYVAPTGDNDSTFGRGPYDANTGAPTTATGNFLNMVHLTGAWTMHSQSGNSTATPSSASPKITDQSTIKTNTLYRLINSPSKMPFIHIRSFYDNAEASHNIMHYEGDLGLTGTTTEYFNIRLTAFHHSTSEQNTTGALDNSSGHWQGTGSGKGSSGKSPIYTLKVGFPSSVTPTQAGYTGDAAIEWVFSPHMRYHPSSGANSAHHKSYGVGSDAGTAWKTDPIEKDFINTSASETSESTTATLANDDFWHDLDFQFDFANRQYRVFHDGTEITSNTMMPSGNQSAPYTMKHTSVTAIDARGWELELVPATETSSQTVAGAHDEDTYYHTLIDRVATYIDLSNPLKSGIVGTDVLLEKVGASFVTNGVSQLDIHLLDDEDNIGLESFFLNDRAWEWKLLCFRDNIDRPLWRGTIRDATIKQLNTSKNTKNIHIMSTDILYDLDRTVPIWDMGQQGITVTDNDEYRREEQQELIDKLYFGANKLKVTKPEIFGGGSHSYKVLTNQRMQLNSAHPIQMYVGENSFGPNEVYRNWEGYPVAGLTYVTSTAFKIWFPYDGSTDHPIYAASVGATFGIDNIEDTNLSTATFTTTSTKGSYSHPNGQEKYQWVQCNSNKTATGGLNDLTLYSLSGAASSVYTATEGKEKIVVLTVTGLSNTIDQLNIRRGTYLSLTDSNTTQVWDHNRSGSATQSFNYTGVWKVLAVHEVFGSNQTRIYLDAPWFGMPGGSGSSGSTDVDELKLTYLQGNADYANTDTIQHSRKHALWMKDLADNSWFRKRFGIIKEIPLTGWGDYAPSGTGSLNGRLSHALTVADPAPSTYSLRMDTNSAMIKALHTSAGKDLICEFHSTSGSLLGSGIITAVSDTNTSSSTKGWLGGAGSDIDKTHSTHSHSYGDVDLIKAAFGYKQSDYYLKGFYGHGTLSHDRWDKRVIIRLNDDTFGTPKSGFSVILSGFDSELGITGIDGGKHNGAFVLERVKDSMMIGKNADGDKYNLNLTSGKNRWFGWRSFNGTNNVGDTDNHAPFTAKSADLTNCFFLRRPGRKQHVTWAELGQDVTASTCPPSPSTATDLTQSSPTRAGTVVKYGRVDLTLDGEFAPKQDIPVGSILKVRDTEDDFKHCWVLWADMRNDGTGDADGGERKTDFGLLLPTVENYTIDLMFTDQTVEGATDSWLSFEPGEDLDIWSFNADNQPISDNAWSNNYSASQMSKYDNWEDEAGAFVVIDFSKFFNLNTEATGGQVGFSSGGKKELGDFITSSAGYAALVDNYWKQAATNLIDPGIQSNYTMNENFHFWNVSVTSVTKNIRISDTTLYVADVTEFPHSGFGRLKAFNGEEMVEDHYIAWHGKSTGVGIDGEDSLNNIKTVSKATLLNQFEQAANGPNAFAYRGMSWNDFRDLMLGHMAYDSSTYADGSATDLFLVSTDKDDTTYDSIQVTTSLSDEYPLRLTMTMNGFVKSNNSGTSQLHDQVRFLNALSLTKNWMQTYSLPALIKTPITKDFYIDGSTSDSFGAVTDVRNKNILSIVKDLSSGSRVGTSGNKINFNYSFGRDGAIDLRPVYNTGIVLNRTNTKVSEHKYSSRDKFTNVRVFYAGGGSFVDYPDPSTTTGSISFKVLDMGSVASDSEARAIAKAEYEKLRNTAHKIQVKPIRDSNTNDLMLANGRYGYIADVTQCTYGRGNNWSAHSRSALPRASMLFPGMVNAFDGNLDAHGVANHGNGAGDLPRWTSSTVFGNFDGNSYDAYNDASPDGDTNRSITSESANWYDWFYWHGSRSVSHAVEIVNLPHHLPLVSDTTGNELRVTVALKTGQSGGASAIDTAEFYVVLTDVATESTYKSVSPQSTTENTGWTKVTVSKNGYHEIAVPTTYYSSTSQFSASSRITISVNYEYLKDLLKYRCYYDDGDTNRLRNAHNMVWLNGVTDSGAYNPNSIFPLGCRIYSQFGEMGELYTMRNAPKLQVVKDLAFLPNTSLQYQDAQAGYSAETALSVKKVVWNIDKHQHEAVTLDLEEDESKHTFSFVGFIRPGQAVSDTFFTGETFNLLGGMAGDGEAQQAADGSADYSADTYTEDTQPSSTQAQNTGTQGSQSFTQAQGGQSQGTPPLPQGGGYAAGGSVFTATTTSGRQDEHTVDALGFGSHITGSTIEGPDGITFPGVSSGNAVISEHVMLIPLPTGMVGTGITVDAIVSLGRNDEIGSSTSEAVLYSEISIIGDENYKKTSSKTIKKHSQAADDVGEAEELPEARSDVMFSNMRGEESEVVRSRIRLFDSENLPGASERGSVAKLVIYRYPDGTIDTLSKYSLQVHSLQVSVKKSDSRRFNDTDSFQI